MTKMDTLRKMLAISDECKFPEVIVLPTEQYRDQLASLVERGTCFRPVSIEEGSAVLTGFVVESVVVGAPEPLTLSPFYTNVQSASAFLTNLIKAERER